MIEWFIGLIIGLSIGLVIGVLLQKSKLVGRLQALEGEATGLRRQMEGERTAAAKQLTQTREDAFATTAPTHGARRGATR